MRALLAAGAIGFVLFGSMPTQAQVRSQAECPARTHWCGPGRGCCSNGEECAPVNGCTGGERTGVKCGTGRCRPGYFCISDKNGVARCEQK